MRLRPLNPKQVPAAFLDCARALREGGHRAYFVGGCVRDLLRGVPVADWDIATSARPEEILRIFQNAVPPGESYTYRFRAEQLGTFWYHTHQVSSKEVKRGLFGVVVYT